MKNKKQNGFIALISAIIISVLLLTITVTLGMTGIMSRFNILDSESKERSIALAEACADKAIFNLAQSVISPSTISVGSDSCSIVSVNSSTPLANQTTIKTQAIINRSYTNLLVVIDTDFKILSWDEEKTF
jgi:hypothetical protein